MISLLIMLASATPVTLNWQGRLLNTDGVPLNGAMDVELVLYADSITSTSFHTETIDPVNVEDGFVAVRLGADSNNLLQSEELMGGAWVQVRIDDLDLGERTELVSVPYAVVASQLDGPARLADTSVLCSGTTVGTLRFRNDTFEGCTSAGWQSLVTANSAGDVDVGGALAVTGNATVSGGLTVVGDQVDARSYYENYSISTANTSLLLPSYPGNWAALVTCSVTGTGASGTSIWLLKRSTSTFLEKIGSLNSTTSNTPQIYISGSDYRIRLYSHGNNYNVRCHFEEII